MSRRTLPLRLAGAGLAVALTVAGGVAGRTLGRDDEPAAAPAPAPPTDGPAGQVDAVEVLTPVAFGPDSPGGLDPGGSSVGLGDVIAVEAAVAPTGPPRREFPAPDVVDLAADPPPVLPELADPLPAGVGPEVGGTAPVTEAFDGGGEPEAGAGGERHVDVCAPLDGTDPPDGCPDGVRSTVLPLVSPPALWISARQLGAGRFSSMDSCAELNPGRGEAGLLVSTNAPGELRVRVWDGPTSGTPVQVVVGATAPADRARWEAQLAAGLPSGPDSLTIHHCLPIGDLPPSSPLSAAVEITDVLGRTATVAASLRSGPTPVRPSTFVVPVGATQLLVSVPHQASQAVDIRAWVSDGSPATCSPPRGAYLLRAGEATRSVAQPAELRARGYIDTYTVRTWQFLYVPEGTTVEVCMRTYDSVGPTFRTARPALTETVLVHSPDLVVPVVRVDSVQLGARLPGAEVQVHLSYVRGNGCGGLTGTVDATNRLQVDYDTACDPVAQPLLFARDVVQDIRVTTWVTRPGEPQAQSSGVIRTRARPCRGGDASGVGASCPTSPTEWYRVPLGLVSVPSGICSPGLFQSSCEPPRSDRIAGAAVIRVDWVGGGSSGRSSWLVEPITTTGRDTTLAELPQLDDSEALRVTGPVGAPEITGTLTADRPVNWRVELYESSCRKEGGVHAVTSSTPSATFPVRLTGLCTGTTVDLVATLTDPATGRSSRWGAYPEGKHWNYGHFWVPAVVLPLTVIVGVTPPTTPTWLWMVQGVTVQIVRPENVEYAGHWDGRYSFPRNPSADPSLRCYQQFHPAAGLYGFSQQGYAVPTSVPDTVVIKVTVVLAKGRGSTDLCYPDGRTQEVVLTTTTTIAEITRPGGLRLASPPDAPFRVIAVIDTR